MVKGMTKGWLALFLLYGSPSRAVTAKELTQLRDIHLPTPVGWWPLAPGWYGLAILVLVIVLILVFYISRSYLNGRAKRQALCLLTNYEQQHQRLPNSQITTARISELLKRVALVYFPREDVASLQGERWLAFLNKTGKRLDFNQVRTALLEQPYQPPQAGNNDLQLLFSMARTWIGQRGAPCLN